MHSRELLLWWSFDGQAFKTCYFPLEYLTWKFYTPSWLTFTGFYYFKCVLALSFSGWIWQKLYQCAIRQYATLTKATGAHLDPSELWSKREWYSAWISWCYCFEWKRLCVLLYIKPHVTKPRSSRKSLFLYSASKMPSFQAVSLEQGSEWVDVTWDDFWRL